MNTRRHFVQVAFDSVPDAIIAMDRRGRVVYLNRAAQKMLSCDAEQSIAQPWQSLFSLTDELAPVQVTDPVAHCVACASQVNLSTGAMMRTASGREFFVECYISPVLSHAQSSQVIGAVLTMKDLTELSEMLASVEQPPGRVGILDKYQFDERFRRILANLRPPREHTLLHMGVTGFDALVAQLGPQFEDLVLRQLSQTLTNKVRSRDMFARLDSEGFVLLLEHCASRQGMDTAKMLHQLLKSKAFQVEGEPLKLPVSIGVLPLNSPGLSVASVLRRAQLASHMAKRTAEGPVMVLMNHGKQAKVSPAGVEE